mmetsp:Transcript_8184/g.18302  ORF Transcript_8184/g.18302 Transcript_8184/m.18302 type:complete len:137 (+) Transcript_8184:1211-1621(+)
MAELTKLDIPAAVQAALSRCCCTVVWMREECLRQLDTVVLILGLARWLSGGSTQSGSSGVLHLMPQPPPGRTVAARSANPLTTANARPSELVLRILAALVPRPSQGVAAGFDHIRVCSREEAAWQPLGSHTTYPLK